MRRASIVPLAFGIILLTGPALAQNADVLTVTGSVVGDLRAGERVTLEVEAIHRGGYRKIDTMQVALERNGHAIEAVVVEPSISAVSIEGVDSVSLIDPNPIEGVFFSIVGNDVTIESRGRRLTVTVPLELLADPPEGARITVSARAGLQRPDPVGITDPYQPPKTFSLIALLLTAGASLFVGALLGQTFGSRRRAGPSVYDTVQRRLDKPISEPSPSATPAPAATRKRVPAKPAAKRAPARKTPADRPAPKKPAPKKTVARKPAAKGKPATRRRPSGGE